MKYVLTTFDHPDMINCMRQKRANILLDHTDAVLMQDKQEGYLYADAATDEGTKAILPVAESIPYDLIVRGDFLYQAVMRSHGYRMQEPYVFFTYTKSVPLNTEHTDITYRLLDQSMTDVVCKQYSYRALATSDYVTQRIEQGMIGAFDHDTCVGFIGIHDSESLGMLEVIPSYRCQGIAENLVKYMVNRQIDKGILPFAEVRLNNKISARLLTKLHFRASGKIINWCEHQSDNRIL